MLPGLNHNVRYKERLFHVQTEDGGLKRPQLMTHVFYDGSVVATETSSYQPFLATNPGPPEIELSVRKRMQDQHKDAIKALLRGLFDDSISRFLPDIVSSPAPTAELPPPPIPRSSISTASSIRPSRASVPPEARPSVEVVELSGAVEIEALEMASVEAEPPAPSIRIEANLVPAEEPAAPFSPVEGQLLQNEERTDATSPHDPSLPELTALPPIETNDLPPVPDLLPGVPAFRSENFVLPEIPTAPGNRPVPPRDLSGFAVNDTLLDMPAIRLDRAPIEAPSKALPSLDPESVYVEPPPPVRGVPKSARKLAGEVEEPAWQRANTIPAPPSPSSEQKSTRPQTRPMPRRRSDSDEPQGDTLSAVRGDGRDAYYRPTEAPPKKRGPAGAARVAPPSWPPPPSNQLPWADEVEPEAQRGPRRAPEFLRQSGESLPQAGSGRPMQPRPAIRVEEPGLDDIILGYLDPAKRGKK